jgi:hypothetical protein
MTHLLPGFRLSFTHASLLTRLAPLRTLAFCWLGAVCSRKTGSAADHNLLGVLPGGRFGRRRGDCGKLLEGHFRTRKGGFEGSDRPWR